MDDRRIKAFAHHRPRSSSVRTSRYVRNDRVKTFPHKLSHLSSSTLERAHKKKKTDTYGTEHASLCSAAQHSASVRISELMESSLLILPFSDQPYFRSDSQSAGPVGGQRSHSGGGKFRTCANKMGECTVWKSGSGSSIGTEGVHFTDCISGITVNWPSCQYFLVVDFHWPVGTLLSDEDNL